MCFSAEASLIAAGVTSAVGLATLARTRNRRELPLAAMPLIFGAQQAIEGALWLSLPGGEGSALVSALTLAFLLIAQVFWPLFTPWAVCLLEPVAARRRLMLGLFGVGVCVASYMAWGLAAFPHTARVAHDHLVYATAMPHVAPLELAYVAAAALPILLASQRGLQAFGAIVMTGCVVAYIFYWAEFVSVWCFFAAAASATLLIHFELSRRHAAAPAAT